MLTTVPHRKVALVTGASSGIGKETARRLLSADYVVYVAARRTEQMLDLQALGAHLVQMDITVDADIVAAVAQIGAAHGGVDVLINNAGIEQRAVTGSDSYGTDWRRLMSVNVDGAAFLT